MGHPTEHLIVGAIFVAVAAALMAVTRNRAIRRRLRVSLVVVVGYLALHLAMLYVPSMSAPDRLHTVEAIERLLLDFALINGAVALLLNPWFTDRVPDLAPAIVQDWLVAVLFLAAALYAVTGKDVTDFLTGSAIAAAVVGFALQDTLANAFAGLAIQVEKPFRVGHWITVASYEGLVTEVTWRATKIRTKAGNLVIVPNSVVAKEAITNYSQPTAPTRLTVEVGAAYGVPPNEAREAVMAAIRRVPRVLAQPAAAAILSEFGGSALMYRAKFWIEDFEFAEAVQDEVRTAIFYEFHRRGIEIPWPIQIQYERDEPPRDSPERREGFARAMAAVPVLAPLPAEAHRALALSAQERLYANGEVIVREGDPGGSMFVVRQGRVAIAIGADHREVAVTEAGGYFGEMSLLTGDARQATVVARGDCTVLEIAGEAFRAYVTSHPEVIDQLAAAAAARRRALDDRRAEASNAPAIEPVSLAARMRRFFGLD
jgi:small-conductance mechanosensitive channel